MAANYWESTQRRNWLFTKDQLAQMREAIEDDEQNLVQMYPLPGWRHLSIYFNQQMNRLAKRLTVRQQAVATAQLYIKRFYTKVEIRRTNPYLLFATALYLACKMEECPQHIRLVTQEARSLWPDFLSMDTSRVGECEFWLISEMSSNLIIHQPYRTLTHLQGDFALTQEELNVAVSIVNDHYMTDLPLLYAPHTVALTALLLCIVLRTSPVPGAAPNIANATAALAQAHARAAGGPAAASADKDRPPEQRMSKLQRFAAFLAESNVDIEAMIDCTQELVSFYECYEQYNDKLTRDQINRFVKARGLDKP